MANDVVRVGQDVIEALYPFITSSPTTPTGAGVSQDVVEVLFADSLAAAHGTQGVVEILVALGPTFVRSGQDIVEVLFPRPGPT